MTDTPKKTVRKIDTLINPIETSEETIDQCLECLLFSGASEFEGTCADLIYALAAERDALKAEVERLREALDDMRGRFRLYTGWPDHNWGGRTDAALLAKADAALKGDAE